jgi:hypothetical protein
MTMSTETETPKERKARESWGFTNNPIWIERVRAFVDAAVADGWSREATYTPSESIDRASKLKRDGFVIQVIARDNPEHEGAYRYEASLNGWGPDGMVIRLPNDYDMEAIRAAVSRCSLCEKAADKTYRYSFAGRCCEACLPAAKAAHEKHGWDN